MAWVPINRNSGVPLIRQVYGQFRAGILSGALAAGQRLPSTRSLAEELSVSRNVVLEAYEQLMAEGFIAGRHGSGTYVAAGAGLLGADGLMQPDEEPTADTPKLIDFRTGVPAVGLVPRKKLARIFHAVCLDAPSSVWGYAAPEGCRELRQALSRYLFRTRGVICSPGHIIVTTGASQGVSLCAKLLTAPGDEVLVEDPLHHDLHRILTAHGAALRPVPADEHGLDTGQIPADARPRLIYLTPSHQFPLGGILPIQRRIDLIRLAEKSGAIIIEDDYDSEFRFRGQPVSALQGLSPAQVIYAGTFSKILSPALRLGFLVVPDALLHACRALKFLSDRHSPVLEQLVLARFIDDGHLESHITKMKRLYRQRQNTLCRCLTAAFGDAVTTSGTSTGLHLIAAFARVTFDDTLVARLEAAGVKVYPVETHACRKNVHHDKLILGYSNLSEPELTAGVDILKQVLDCPAPSGSL